MWKLAMTENINIEYTFIQSAFCVFSETCHLRPVAIGRQPLHELGDCIFPRLWILPAHDDRLVELQQSWNPETDPRQVSANKGGADQTPQTWLTCYRSTHFRFPQPLRQILLRNRRRTASFRHLLFNQRCFFLFLTLQMNTCKNKSKHVWQHLIEKKTREMEAFFCAANQR